MLRNVVKFIRWVFGKDQRSARERAYLQQIKAGLKTKPKLDMRYNPLAMDESC